MIIACPNCSTGYMLPEHLVGPGGARVRCPRCQHLFAVDADGRPGAPAPAPSGRLPATAEEAPAATPSPVAAAEPDTVEQVPAAAPPPIAAAEPESEAMPESEGHLVAAREVLEQLAVHEGEAIERAAAERRFFAEFGPALMVAYEAYRRRVGEDADPVAFRTALRERWGVELLPLATREM